MIYSPITKNKNVLLIKSYKATDLINAWGITFSIDISSELKGVEKIELYKCNETGLRFFSPLEVTGSKELYVALQKFDWFYMSWKWEHEVLFSRLNKNEKVLEVGCAEGAFIERLCDSGFEVEGIEFNSVAVGICKKKGLLVSSMDMKELAISNAELFDVVCSFQVLEHVPEPYAYLYESLALLKSGGRLVICVPNNDSFLHYQYNLLDMPPHHMTQWNINVFRSIEKLFPVKLTCVKYEPLAKYHVKGYLCSHQKRLVERHRGFRFLINKYTLPIYDFVLNFGLRHLCRGQSIYVEFTKL